MTTSHIMTLDEAINRVVSIYHIEIFYNSMQTGTLMAIKHNCIYAFDKLEGVKVVPLRNRTINDFKCVVDSEHLLKPGDSLFVDMGEMLECYIVGFKRGMQTAPIVVETLIGNAKVKYEISQSQILWFDILEPDDIEEVA